MDVGSARRLARDRLSAAGRGDGELSRDADRIVGLALGWPATRVLAFGESELTAATTQRLDDLLARRGAGEPFAYLAGEREFFELAFAVSPAVLVPRPETELLVEVALAVLPQASLLIADLGTGSGAVALSLAHARPAWNVLAVDDCTAALAVAGHNRARHGLHNVSLLHADWTRALAGGRLDAIVSNPPYIAAGDRHLPALRHEPLHALLAGADGLAAIHTLLADAPRVLRPGGFLALEHGADQAFAVRARCAALGFVDIETRRDLAGCERVTSAWRC